MKKKIVIHAHPGGRPAGAPDDKIEPSAKMLVNQQNEFLIQLMAILVGAGALQ